MHPRAPKLLEDIRNAADFVKTATCGVVLTQFKQDRLLRQAVERIFEIVVEALHRLEKDDPGHRRPHRRLPPHNRLSQCLDPWLRRDRTRHRLERHNRDLAPLLRNVEALLKTLG